MSVQTMYQDTIAKIEKVLEDPTMETGQKYGKITDLVLFSRVNYLRQILLNQVGGPVVQSGPFQGMRFHTSATEGCYIPKLLGCYEEELHPLIHKISKENTYDRIINVGCAEGYYAVGLALCMPSVKVLAFDINPKAQASCRELAEANNVADRVLVGGKVSPEDWTGLIDERVLIVSDCEGAEYELLDPDGCPPELKQADMLIELHHSDKKPELAQVLLNKYRDTHAVQVIGHKGRNPSQYNELQNQKHLDQLLSVWEFRGGPTPWAYLKAKSSVG